MSLYSLDDLIDKSMIASRDGVVSRTGKYNDSPVYATYQKGDTIGTLFSWVKNGADTWLMFYDFNGKPYYFNLSQKNAIDRGDLSSQGVLTTEEKQIIAENENKDYFTRIYEGLFNFLLLGAIAYLIHGYITKK